MALEGSEIQKSNFFYSPKLFKIVTYQKTVHEALLVYNSSDGFGLLII